MIIYTDKFDAIEGLIKDPNTFSLMNSDSKEFLKNFFPQKKVYGTEIESSSIWSDLIYAEHSIDSQFDLLNQNIHKLKKCSNVVCVAETGENFHGFRNRKWEAVKGNLHLSIFLNPNQFINNVVEGILILACVSVIQLLEDIKGLEEKAKIKWINDIYINDAKICGVIAQTHFQGDKVEGIVIGIGLNVENNPKISPDECVRKTSCINNELTDNKKINPVSLLFSLLHKIEINYKKLLNNKFGELFDYYIKKSFIIGRKVTLVDDLVNENSILAQGFVDKIGNNLELYISGYKEPFTKGRLIF